MLKGLFRKRRYAQVARPTGPAEGAGEAQLPLVPEGLWVKCPYCSQPVYRPDMKQHRQNCKAMDTRVRLSAFQRLALLLDEGSFQETDGEMTSVNPLDFPKYEEKLDQMMSQTGLGEGVVTGQGTIQGQPLMIGVMDGRFLMGSMGSVVGEKLTRMVETATRKRLPVVIVTASGGARMQEGIFSLMQMAKVSGALARHHQARLFYLALLTDPTTGGVTASFAMLGDVILAEPGALIGFAGPRVIEQTIRQKLPEGFQRAEFLLQHGLVDGLVSRSALKDTVGRLLRLHGQQAPIKPENKGARHPVKKATGTLSAWEKVNLARHPKRPTALDYIQAIFHDFTELHGDRLYGDDRALIGGIASLNGIPVTVIGQQKGRNTKENLERNFAMPHPEGYRKALRLMKQAEKFGRPVICLIDTPGAFCGIGAEERGQGEAIARNLLEMMQLQTPVISVVIGEGGSGGALALGVADQVWMLEHGIYSVLSPEGFASILWKDGSRRQEAAGLMKLTAQDLYRLRIIDGVLAEPPGGAHEDLEAMVGFLKDQLLRSLNELSGLSRQSLLELRYEKFRRLGRFSAE